MEIGTHKAAFDVTSDVIEMIKYIFIIHKREALQAYAVSVSFDFEQRFRRASDVGKIYTEIMTNEVRWNINGDDIESKSSWIYFFI